MLVEIKIPVELAGKTFQKGQHQLEGEQASGWFFEALVKDGSIVIIEAEEQAVPEELPKKAKVK